MKRGMLLSLLGAGLLLVMSNSNAQAVSVMDSIMLGDDGGCGCAKPKDTCCRSRGRLLDFNMNRCCKPKPKCCKPKPKCCKPKPKCCKPKPKPKCGCKSKCRKPRCKRIKIEWNRCCRKPRCPKPKCGCKAKPTCGCGG